MNAYLGLNPEIAQKLSGVIYSAPCFGFYNKMNPFMKLFYSLTGMIADDYILVGAPPIHRISRNKQYLRQVVNQKKVFPLMSSSLMASFNRNINRV